MSALQSGVVRGVTTTFEAEAAITKYAVVKQGTGDGQVKMTDTQGEKAIGVALNAAAAGEAVEVLITGICPVVITTAASFAVGDSMTPSASTDNGKVEEAASGDYVLGYLLDAPAADDDQVMAVIQPERVPIA